MANYLNAKSYSLLLKALSPNEEAAASLFIKLRDSLVRFFELKGDVDPIQSADETLDRVSTKLQSVVIEEMTRYSFGVARLIFLENLRKLQREEKALKDYSIDNDRQASTDDDDPYAWMRDCFGELPDESKGLLSAYFADMPRNELDEERERLAGSMGVSLNSLRLKVFRLRRRLEDCVRGKRLQGSA